MLACSVRRATRRGPLVLANDMLACSVWSPSARDHHEHLLCRTCHPVPQLATPLVGSARKGRSMLSHSLPVPSSAELVELCRANSTVLVLYGPGCCVAVHWVSPVDRAVVCTRSSSPSSHRDCDPQSVRRLVGPLDPPEIRQGDLDPTRRSRSDETIWV